jgi:16S rRNA (cytidine1402-2'-O)-methyltransferase
MNINHFGSLYIVATPIGNLRDMTSRAIEILKSVNCIAAEDTRHSAPLLQHFLVTTPAISLHEHNERERTLQLLERLLQGESIALISDAGTPLINDPGYFLVREARKQGIKVIPIPGASAVIAALSVSGLPTNKFSFEGFLPAKSKHRIEQLELLQHETRTLVFYEAPHRILDCLQDMQKVFGSERQAVIARELTKMYETIRGAALVELIDWVQHDSYQQRGEIVLIVQGAAMQLAQDENTISGEHILKILLKELPLKQAVDLMTKISGGRKNELYQRALILKNQAE